MAKSKMLKMPDHEVLKHYQPCDGAPELSRPGAHVTKILDKTQASKPVFTKAVLAVDHAMAKRKSAVVKSPTSGKRKKQK